MTEGQRMFLAAAEEENFARAAQNMYVTPQCISDHIKRLEELYGVKLFDRKPKVRLTKKGEVLFKWLLRIQSMEQAMLNELSGYSGDIPGTIRFGSPGLMGSTIIPSILPGFRRRYPNIDVQITFEETRKLEDLFRNGDLDLFVGVSADEDPAFDRIPVKKEPLYLVLPFSLLKQQFPAESAEILADFRRDGADLSRLRELPIIQEASRSTISQAVRELAKKEQISIRTPFKYPNYDILIDLCLSGEYATICSTGLLKSIVNQDPEIIRRLICVLPIRGCDSCLSVDIIRSRALSGAVYLEDFTSRLKEVLVDEDLEIMDWLDRQWLPDSTASV